MLTFHPLKRQVKLGTFYDILFFLFFFFHLFFIDSKADDSHEMSRFICRLLQL